KTASQTDAIYCRRCIPRKARIDLIYQANRTLCLDIWLMAKTAAKMLPF
ncbi:MAG: sugar transferase, partial [Alphaproteobacteria bacterium]|nr:sugar transferase [Alphaproteobacteria bacterium]